MFSHLRPLFPYLRRYWRSFALGGLALIVYNAAKAMIPLLIGGAMNDIQHDLSAAKVEHHGLRLLGVAVIAAIALYLTRQIIIGASREIVAQGNTLTDLTPVRFVAQDAVVIEGRRRKPEPTTRSLAAAGRR